MLGRGAAAATHHIDPAHLRKLFQKSGGDRRGFIEACGCHGVGKPRIGVDADGCIREPRELFHIGPHEGRTEGAVKPNGNGLSMAHAVPEGLHSLPRKNASRGIRDGTGDHDRQSVSDLLKDGFQRKDGSLGIERIEDGLD